MEKSDLKDSVSKKSAEDESEAGDTASSVGKKKSAASGKKTAAKKTVAKKSAAKKSASKKSTAKSASSKKASAKKTATTSGSGSKTAKKAATKKAAGANSSADADVVKTSVNGKSTEEKVAKTGLKATEDDADHIVDPDIDQDDDTDSSDLPSGLSKAPVPYERGGGHYMDAEQLAYFSKKLAEWKQQLMEEVDRTVGHMKDDATNFPDPNDRATQEEEFSLELRTRDRERKLIKKINEAQKRIDDDEYGYCETCGIEIGVSRLEARPTAELCIDCNTLEEIRERQTA